MNRSDFVSFNEGIERGFDKPSNLYERCKRGEILSPIEDKLLRGIDQAKQDSKLLKEEVSIACYSLCLCTFYFYGLNLLNTEQRGGPLFFPHLREEEIKRAKEQMRGETKRCDAASRHIHIIPKLFPTLKRNKIRKQSLELCSGVGVMSSELYKEEGFITKTLDHDMKRSADSHLSLAQVKQKILDGSIHRDPHLNFSFDFLWAAPCWYV